MACSKANEPYIRDTESNFELVMVYDVVGNPFYIDISDDYVFVAEDQTGFSYFSRGSATLHRRVSDYFDSKDLTNQRQLRNTRFIRYIPERNLLFIGDETGSNASFIWSYRVDPTDTGVLVLTNLEWRRIVRDLVYDIVPTNPDLIYAYWGSFTDAQIYKIHKCIHDMYFDPDYDSVFEEISSMNLPNQSFGITLDGEYIIMSLGQWGVNVYHKEPVISLVATVDTPGQALDVAINGSVIYVADRHFGLQVIDATDRSAPVLLSGVAQNTSGFATSVDFLGNTLALASGSGGVYIYDISDPFLPVFVERMYMSTIGFANKVKFFGDDLYIASREKGVLRYKHVDKTF
jgi:hypothetical protein